MLATLTALLLSVASVAADPDPEPQVDQAEFLKKIAKKMDDLAARLKRGSADEGTRRLQKQVMEQLDKALRQEKAKAKKAPRGRSTDTAARLNKVRAIQARIGPALEARGAPRAGRVAEKNAKFNELSNQQTRIAQILREIAARSRAAR